MIRYPMDYSDIDWGELEALFAAAELGGRKGDRLHRVYFTLGAKSLP